MKNQFDDEDPRLLQTDEEEYATGLPRWISALAVGVAGVMFSALAIYAYRAGSHPTDATNLAVIEADKTPIKEKPANPGGMQFPNQDKAVFGMLTNQQADGNAEHVAAATEEPVKREDAAPATASAVNPGSNWVNDKLRADGGPSADQAKDAGKTAAADAKDQGKEMLMAAKPADVAALAPAAGGPSGNADVQPPHTISLAQAAPDAAAEPAPAAAAAATPTATDTPPTVVTVPDAPVATVAQPAPVHTEKKKTAAASAKKTTLKHALSPSSGGHMIQLGAYRSEGEAHTAWSHIAAKHSALAGLMPTVQKADLGAKGTYYRLRVAVQNAKIVCSQLSAEKQPCMPVK